MVLYPVGTEAQEVLPGWAEFIVGKLGCLKGEHMIFDGSAPQANEKIRPADQLDSRTRSHQSSLPRVGLSRTLMRLG